MNLAPAASGYLEFLATEHRFAIISLAAIVTLLGALSVLAWRAPPRRHPYFTFDLRHKVYLYWSVTALAVIASALVSFAGARLIWVIGVVLIELVNRSNLLGRMGFDERPASPGWSLVGRLAPVLLVAVAGVTMLATSYHSYQVWAPLEAQARQELAERTRLAAGGGYPLDPKRAIAKIMLAEPGDTSDPPGWAPWPPFPSVAHACHRLDYWDREWRVCSNDENQTRLVEVTLEPLATADQRAVLRDALRLMMWVIDRDASEAVKAAALARLDAVRAAETDIPFGDVVLHVRVEQNYRYVIQAPAPGKPIPDSAAISF
ncbi:MAG: hypothetical protein GC145_12670 [Caulobacter sp.]|nr:hypothetical protein [Caulobacter sp.]